MASATTEGALDACCLNEYRPLSGTPNGQIIKIAGINCYHISGKDETSKGKTIVLLTDIFGLVKNPRIIADDVSQKSGFDVYVPDLFNGDAVHSSFMKYMPEVPGDKSSIGAKLALNGKTVTLGPWLFRHRQSITLPIVEKFYTALRTERGVTRIQAVGYCFGGYYALLSGSAQHQLVDAVVGCHVSLTSKAQYEQIKVPLAMVCAQEDNQLPDSLRREAEQILARKSDIPSRFQVFEGTAHGFASRPNPDNPLIMKAYEQANDLIAEWAKTHL